MTHFSCHMILGQRELKIVNRELINLFDQVQFCLFNGQFVINLQANINIHVIFCMTLRWNATRLLQQLEDHYEANSWLSREPLPWPRSLSGIPAAMNYGKQSAIVIAGCGLTCLLWRQNTIPVILCVKPSFDLSFCLFWCEISCSGVRFFKNNHTIF